MNKKALALAFILVFPFLALAVLQSVILVTADPMPFPPTPNTDPPILTVQSPCNTTYYVNVVSLNFTVTMPDSWGRADPRGTWYSNQNHIEEISYLLDGQKFVMDRPSTPPKVRNFSIVLEVVRGEHTLQINVLAESPYNPILPFGQGYPDKNYGFPEFYPMAVSQTINFTVDAGPFPSPSPTPSQSQSPSPSPSPSAPNSATQSVLAIVAATIIVMTVTGVMLRKRHKANSASFIPS